MNEEVEELKRQLALRKNEHLVEMEMLQAQKEAQLQEQAEELEKVLAYTDAAKSEQVKIQEELRQIETSLEAEWATFVRECEKQLKPFEDRLKGYEETLLTFPVEIISMQQRRIMDLDQQNQNQVARIPHQVIKFHERIFSNRREQELEYQRQQEEILKEKEAQLQTKLSLRKET